MAPRHPASRIERVRLVHLASYDSAHTGSFIGMLRAVFGAATARGWAVDAVLSKRAAGHDWVDQLSADGVNVHFVSLDSRLSVGRELARLLREDDRPTILHTHFTRFDIPAVLAREFQSRRRRSDLAVVWHIHTTPPSGRAAWPRNFLKFGVIGRPVRRILCVGPQIAHQIRRAGGRRSAVAVLDNAIDTGRFSLVSQEERVAAREFLNLPQDTPVLLHFGWDWRIKGGDCFLGAANILKEEGLNVIAMTVGAGPEAALLRDQLGLEESVVIHPPTEDVRTLYAAADVLVSSSRVEGSPSPFAVTEALSCGIPVVASRIDGRSKQLLASGAYRLSELDAIPLAAEIRSLLDRDTSTIQANASEAHKWVKAHIDLQPWTERLFALYDQLTLGR
jgi:glycosyltransferase involved in cell wall biosynthesis